MKPTDKISDDQKFNLLENPHTPTANYDFKRDAVRKRSFRHAWLHQYSPWLSYSVHLKGAVCKFCTLFPPPVHRGTQGAFITLPFTKYKDFNESARSHQSSDWHQNAQLSVSNFLKVRNNPENNIICKLDSAVNQQVEEN